MTVGASSSAATFIKGRRLLAYPHTLHCRRCKWCSFCSRLLFIKQAHLLFSISTWKHPQSKNSNFTMFNRSTQLLALLLVGFVVILPSSARSTHFGGESNQINQEQEGNLVDNGLTPLQLEILAQRLSEYNNQVPQIPSAWDRLARNPEVKRQSRYRQCYFNPISCFKK